MTYLYNYLTNQIATYFNKETSPPLIENSQECVIEILQNTSSPMSSPIFERKIEVISDSDPTVSPGFDIELGYGPKTTIKNQNVFSYCSREDSRSFGTSNSDFACSRNESFADVNERYPALGMPSSPDLQDSMELVSTAPVNEGIFIDIELEATSPSFQKNVFSPFSEPFISPDFDIELGYDPKTTIKNQNVFSYSSGEDSPSFGTSGSDFACSSNESFPDLNERCPALGTPSSPDLQDPMEPVGTYRVNEDIFIDTDLSPSPETSISSDFDIELGYDPKTTSFASRPSAASMMTWDWQSALKNHLDVNALSECIQRYRLQWQRQAAMEGGTLFIRAGTVPGLSRSVIVHNNSVLVLLNQKKLGDKLLGEGTFKKVTIAFDFDTGKRYASAGMKPDAASGAAQAERKQLYSVKGLDGFTQLVCETSYPSKTIAGVNKMRLMIELAELGDLEKAIAAGTLSYEQKILITRQILVALANLHGYGNIHRDLKPANILLSAQQGALISDLGSICRANDTTAIQVHSTTSWWASPEYACEMLDLKMPQSSATTKHDVWAVGVILYQLWYQKNLPWFQSSESSTFESLKALPADLQTHLALDSLGIPPIAQLIGNMLETDPAKRISAQKAYELSLS